MYRARSRTLRRRAIAAAIAAACLGTYVSALAASPSWTLTFLLLIAVTGFAAFGEAMLGAWEDRRGPQIPAADDHGRETAIAHLRGRGWSEGEAERLLGEPADSDGFADSVDTGHHHKTEGI